jgi:hypothetical protein
MADKLFPAFDHFHHQRVSPEMEMILSTKAIERFQQLHPEYATAEDLQILQEFCFVRSIPITLRNLEISMHDAIEDGRLDKSNRDTLAALEQFREECPEWENFTSKKNGAAIERWLQEQHLDVTVENLHKAFTVCVKARLILPTPQGQGIISTKNAVFIRSAVTPEDRATYADDIHAPDSVRKKQDADLRRKAVAERYARRTS